MLLVVLSLGAAMLVVAATTLLSVRNSGKVAGMQRQDYQDIHAAEAGIVRTQARFNQITTLCSGFFSKEDSNDVVAGMTDAIYTLPSSYGPTRAVRVSDFQVVPGRPMRIKFRSMGGRVNGSSFDSSASHVLTATLRMSTLGDYATFVLTQKATMGDNLTYLGKVHADTLVTKKNIVFKNDVTYKGAIIFDSGMSVVTFMKGYRQVNSNPFTLDRIYIDDNSGSTCGANTYKDLAAGTVSGEGTGFTYTGAASAIYVPLDSIRFTTTLPIQVVLPYYNVDLVRRPPQGTLLGTWSVSAASFNGVIYSSKDVYLEDTLSNFSLTVTSGMGIYATGNIRCVGNELANSNNRVTLGIIPKLRFHFWEKAPTSQFVEAVVAIPDTNWWVDGDNTTRIGRDSLGNACPVATPACWNLRLFGGSITKRGSGSGYYSANGLNRRYDYDPDHSFSPPPKFPALYGQSGGVSVWNVAEVGENN